MSAASSSSDASSSAPSLPSVSDSSSASESASLPSVSASESSSVSDSTSVSLASVSTSAGSSALPATLAVENGFAVTAEHLPVYTFSGDVSTIDPTAWPPVMQDGQQLYYNGQPLFTFIGDTPGVLPRGSGGDGGAWNAVQIA